MATVSYTTSWDTTSATAKMYFAECSDLLNRRLGEITAKAVTDRHEDVRVRQGGTRLSSLKAVTPDEAEPLAQRLYSMMPTLRSNHNARHVEW